MKRLLFVLLALSSLPCVAGDRLPAYCLHLVKTERLVVLAYDAQLPMSTLNRNNLDAEGLAGDDLLMLINSTYSGSLDNAPMEAIIRGTYEWCLLKHAYDMQG